MDGTIRTCLRTLGILLLFSFFSTQAQASFPQKTETDLNTAIESAKNDLREAVQNYESEFQQRIAQENSEIQEILIPVSTAFHFEKVTY